MLIFFPKDNLERYEVGTEWRGKEFCHTNFLLPVSQKDRRV